MRIGHLLLFFAVLRWTCIQTQLLLATPGVLLSTTPTRVIDPQGKMMSALFLVIAMVMSLPVPAVGQVGDNSLAGTGFLACVAASDLTTQARWKWRDVPWTDACAEYENVVERCLHLSQQKQQQPSDWKPEDVQYLQDRLDEQGAGCTIDFRSVLSRMGDKPHPRTQRSVEKLRVETFRLCKEKFDEDKKNLRHVDEACGILHNYLGCSVFATGDQLSDADIARLQELVDNEMKKYKLSCDINVRRMMRPLQRCIDKYGNAKELQDITKFCGIAKKYLNCVFATGVINELPDTVIALSQDVFDSVISKSNLRCDVNVRRIWKEAKNRNTGAKSSPVFGLFVLLATTSILLVLVSWF